MIRSPDLTAARALIAADRKARKAERPAREKRSVGHVNLKADRGRVRDNGYLAFLRRQSCIVGIGVLCIDCDGRTDPAHTRTSKPGEPPTGLQRKPDDRRATPLCRKHHDEQHRGNEMAFWRKYGLDPFAVAERLFAMYQAEGAR